MIDYNFQGRLQYISGGSMTLQMNAWPAAGVGTNPGTTNLLAWWALDETTGTRADSHSNGFNLGVVASPGYTTGKKGNAVTVNVVNGVGSYVATTDSGNLLDCPAGSSITVCCWVYLNNLPSNNAYPVTRWGGGGGSAADWGFNIYANGRAEATAARASAQTNATTGAGVISATTWYFLTLIFDHTVGTYGTVSIAVNNGTPTSAALPSEKVAGSGLQLSIGDLGHVSAGYGNMSGAVDEVCVYQRVLTADELAWLYNGGNGRAYSEL
jgi:hypothetical protein